jgi:single-strand DNA-binding protein
MADSLNKVMLIGNVGDDPKIVELNNASKKLASFSLATSHHWVDSKTKERKSNTEWHRIVLYGEGLVGILQKTGIKKGTKLFIEGKLVNRKWVDQSGQNRTTTEIVLQGFNCNIVVLSSRDGGDRLNGGHNAGYENSKSLNDGYSSSPSDDDFLDEDFPDLDDDKIPF